MDLNILITPQGMPAEPINRRAFRGTIILDRRVFDDLISDVVVGPTNGYLRPGGVDYYLRPGGVDEYERP